MDFKTKVEILKANGFEECGDRTMEKFIDLSKCSENHRKRFIETSNKCNFLLRFDDEGKPMWYSEEYIRNTDIDKILNPFNSINADGSIEKILNGVE